MGTKSRVTHASGKILITYMHSSGSQNSLENVQKVDISRRKYDTGREEKRLLACSNVPALKPDLDCKRPVNEWGRQTSSEHIGTNEWSV